MKLLSTSIFSCIAFILFCTGTVMSQSSYDLRSPDNRVEIRIRTAERVKYDVLFKGSVLLQDCTLSLNVEHQVFGVSPKVVSAPTNPTVAVASMTLSTVVVVCDIRVRSSPLGSGRSASRSAN